MEEVVPLAPNTDGLSHLRTRRHVGKGGDHVPTEDNRLRSAHSPALSALEKNKVVTVDSEIRSGQRRLENQLVGVVVHRQRPADRELVDDIARGIKLRIHRYRAAAAPRNS